MFLNYFREGSQLKIKNNANSPRNTCHFPTVLKESINLLGDIKKFYLRQSQTISAYLKCKQRFHWTQITELQGKPKCTYLIMGLVKQDHIRPPVGQHSSYNSQLSLLTPHFNIKLNEFSVRAKHPSVHVSFEEYSLPTLAAVNLSNIFADRYYMVHRECQNLISTSPKTAQYLRSHMVPVTLSDKPLCTQVLYFEEGLKRRDFCPGG